MFCFLRTPWTTFSLSEKKVGTIYSTNSSNCSLYSSGRFQSQQTNKQNPEKIFTGLCNISDIPIKTAKDTQGWSKSQLRRMPFFFQERNGLCRERSSLDLPEEAGKGSSLNSYSKKANRSKRSEEEVMLLRCYARKCLQRAIFLLWNSRHFYTAQ